MALKLAVFCVALLAAVPSHAATNEEPDRPRCTSHNTGEFYPLAANKNHELAQKLVRCGELEICARTSTWRYRWQPLSISIDQLLAKKNREVPQPSSACLAKQGD